MRQLYSALMGLLLITSVGFISAAPNDPMWMFSDQPGAIYSSFRYCDTARTNYLCISSQYDELVDTGSYDGSKYINFDYQFSSNLFVIINRWDETDTLYRDYRPGYAGFKTAWDDGMTGYYIARYNYLILKHKGPNLNHKVSVAVWYNDGECGSPSYREELGSFSASAEWKEDTIVIPESFHNKTDILRNGSKYFELNFIINNLDPNDTTSGPPGNFKVDDILLVGCNPIETSPVSQTVNENAPCVLKVKAEPPANHSADILTYQWIKDGAPIAGATDSIYSIPNTMLEQAGAYTVAVTVPSTGNIFTSLPAIVTVTDDPSFTPGEENSGCGCGAGTGLAFLPPIFIRMMARRKRKNQK